MVKDEEETMGRFKRVVEERQHPRVIGGLLATLIVLSACAGAGSNSGVTLTSEVEGPSTSAGGDASESGVGESSGNVTRLTLAATGGFADAQIHHLMDAVVEVSDGGLQIEPAEGWDVTGTLQDVEQEIIEAAASGEIDLGWVGTRAFAAMGVTDFDALTAPMLIDSYALERTVLDSDIPPRMLRALEQLGVSGLAVMGGALRGPSGVDSEFLGPESYSGATFHSFRSQLGEATFTALGATHTDVVPAERDTGLSDGSIDGFENSLAFFAGKPAFARHVTLNVAFWPGIGVLVASPETMSRIGDQQSEWLRGAAADTSAQSVDLVGDDQGAVEQICVQGGAVHLASTSDIASLREALQPVYDQLTAEAVTAEIIAEINELKNSIDTEELVVPEGCADGDVAAESDPRLPEGAYGTAELTAEDAVAALRARGVEVNEELASSINAEFGDQTYATSIIFESGRFIQSLSKDGGPPEVGSSGTYTVLDDDTIEFFETCCGTTPVEFSFDGEALELRLGFEDRDVQAFCAAQPLDCLGIVVFESGPLMRRP
jgi:TRAP-type C4-dicarboxylate transport system substrate-binding protein